MEEGSVVRATQKFWPQIDEELPLNIGDIIQVHQQIDRYWLYGCSRGVCGNFPKDCVVVIDNDQIPQFLDGNELFVALEEFTAQEHGDLRFGKGEFIVGIEPVDSNWWRGRCGIREGIFPLTLVWALQTNLIKKATSTKKVQLMARVLMDLQAQLPEEIDLRKGDTVTVTEVIDKEWYRGELNGKCGIFPSAFVQLLESDAQDTSPSLPDLLSFQISDKMENIFKRSVSPLPQEFKEITNHIPPVPTVCGYGRVAFDFDAQYENELSVSEGETVKILERIDAQWVEVEKEGRTGLVPSCYVTPVESSVLALYDFTPQLAEDVSLRRGERVTILKKMNSDWLLVTNSTGQTGLCPCNYVTNTPENVHGSITADEDWRPSIPESYLVSQKTTGGLDDSIAKNLAALDKMSPSSDGPSWAKPNTSTSIIPDESEVQSSPTSQRRAGQASRKLNARSMSEVGPNRHKIACRANENRPVSYQSTVHSEQHKVGDRNSSSWIPHRPAPAVPPCSVQKSRIVSHHSSSDEGKSVSRASSISTVSSSSSGDGSVIFAVNSQTQNAESGERRRLVIQELVQTEKDFLNHMRFCHNVFMEDNAIPRHPGVDLETLLAYLDEVLAAGLKLQRLLDEELKIPEDKQIFGKCFQLVKDDLKVAYGNYCRNHDEVLNLLDQYEDNASIQMYFKNKMESPGAPRNYFNFGSVLIKPVQRILKYPLLLNELIKTTPNGHPDKSYLLGGLTAMTEVAKAINECKRRKDLVRKYRKESDTSLSSKIAKISLHSVAKKSQRFGMRLSSTLGITSGTRDHIFDEDEIKFREMDRSIKVLHKNAQTFSDQLEEYVRSQFQLSDDIASYYMEKEKQLDVNKYRAVQLEIANIILTDFKSMIDRRVINPLDALLKAFTGPNNLISKRHDKLLDYDSANQRVERNKDPARTKMFLDELQIARNDYDALNTQLLEELPKLTVVSSLVLNDCLKAFIYARRRFIGRVAKEIFPLMELPLLMSSSGNILDSFQIKHNMVVDVFKGITCVAGSTHSTGLTRTSSSSESNPREKDRRSGSGQTTVTSSSSASPLTRPKLQANPCERKAEQSSSQRAFIQSKFPRDMLYVSTINYERMALLDIGMHIGDIVGVIKKQDPMGTSDRWFIDNGAVQGFVPSKYLSLLHGTDTYRPDTPSIDDNFTSRTPSPCLVPTKVNSGHYETVHRYDEVSCEPYTENLSANATEHRYETVTESSPAEESTAFPSEFFYAMYDFGATGPSTLSLAKGQVVLVLHQKDLHGNPEWWFVQDRYGNQGYAPGNYLARCDTS